MLNGNIAMSEPFREQIEKMRRPEDDTMDERIEDIERNELGLVDCGAHIYRQHSRRRVGHTLVAGNA